MTTPLSLTGGQVLRPGGQIETTDVHMAGGRIIEAPAAGSVEIDCRGHTVLPGIVDVHGDAFELELHPRPSVDIAFDIAMGSVDRQLLVNGITTAYHGLTLSWEPGARSLSAGRRFMAALPALRPRLIADHRVQIRWETFAHEAIADLGDWLAADPKPAIAFNDHTTSTIEKISAGNHLKIEQWAQRAGLTVAQYTAAVDAVAAHACEVPTKIRRVAELARRTGAVMLSHDERTRRERATNRDLGMAVCEFPLAKDVAADAVANGEHVVLGGPNVIRGGSHTGAISAEDGIREGVCTILASDYYYPSLLHAAEHLVKRGVLEFSAAWNLISANPAAAMGLSDRGNLAPGQRADIVVIDRSGPWRLAHTIAGGAPTSLARH